VLLLLLLLLLLRMALVGCKPGRQGCPGDVAASDDSAAANNSLLRLLAQLQLLLTAVSQVSMNIFHLALLCCLVWSAGSSTLLNPRYQQEVMHLVSNAHLPIASAALSTLSADEPLIGYECFE
jgi:hypothetical protein